MKLTWMSVLSGCALVLSGCVGSMEAPEAGEEADLGEVMSALVGENALSLNALSLNALSLNALSINALSLNGLSAQNLQALRDPGLTGQYSRQFMRYAVGKVSSARARQRRRFATWWNAMGVAPATIEAGDHLLTV